MNAELNRDGAGMNDGYARQTDRKALTVATALFFMVGFLTVLNDVIVPHLKSIFELNYTEALLVQFAFFSSYFVFSFPSGKIVDRLGYKRTMVVGLLVMAAGAAMFLPAASTAKFGVFLAALVMLAAGMTVVQVAVNAYVTLIGPARTASSRLNLAQAMNSVGTFIGPVIGGMLILGSATQVTPERLHAMSEVARQAYRQLQASTVRLPYIVITLTLVLLAIALAAVKLKPQEEGAAQTEDFRPGSKAGERGASVSIWSKGWAVAAAGGIFAYVGAEVTIGSLLVLYMGLPRIAGLPESTAANFLAVYWGGAMVGRFLGSAILQKVRTGPLLALAALVAFGLVLTSIFSHGSLEAWVLPPMHVFGWHWQLFVPKSLAMWSLLAVGFCNSIMFPSIFTLGVQGLGALTSKGSSLLIAAIVGGAIVPLLTGRLADKAGLQVAFVLPALCYVYIAGFGWMARRRGVEADAPVVDVVV